AASCPELAGPLHVRTERRGEYVWAWTLAGTACARQGQPLPGYEGGATWGSAEKVHSCPPVMEVNS
ncbi:MAG TPA: hypothetical protein VGH33_10700, partial [Isosphaeraceae bacterium]